MTAQQLRNSILQQAIQGRLVPQDPNDEPASVLLERIRKEKEQLVKEGKLKKKDLATTPIADDEIPFDIPSGWEWCRLGTLIYLLSGQDLTPDRYTSEEGGIPYITGASCFMKGKLLLNRWTTSPTSVSHYGDLLITCKGTVGTMAYNQIGDIHIARQIMAISSKYMYLPYIQYFLEYMVPNLEKQAHSIIPGISRDVLLNLPIPLPPLAEQRRIVAKIEELMPLVEKYGKAQTELDTLNQDLPRRLRQSVLQQAIQGKLVEQDPNDEPASVLLERIRKEKEQLVKEGKLKKKDLATTPIADDEKPFDIPENWEWAKVGNIFQTYSGGTPDKGHPEYYSSNDVKWAKVGDLGSLYLSETEEYISTTGMENSSAKLYPVQTVLVAMYCNDAIGKSSVTKSVMASNQAICGLLPNSNVLPEYLYYVIQYFRPSLIEKSAGGAQKNINQKIVNDIVFPLPPLAEQRRIVAKIEELFAEIDKLK